METQKINPASTPEVSLDSKRNKTFITVVVILLVGILAVLLVLLLNQNSAAERMTSEKVEVSDGEEERAEDIVIAELPENWGFYTFERCAVEIPTPPQNSETSENGVTRKWSVMESSEIKSGGFEADEVSVGYYTYDSMGVVVGGQVSTYNNFVIDCIENEQGFDLEGAFQVFLESVQNENEEVSSQGDNVTSYGVFVERTGDTTIFGVDAIRYEIGGYLSSGEVFEQLFFVLNDKIYRVAINSESYEEIVNQIVEGVVFR